MTTSTFIKKAFSSRYLLVTNMISATSLLTAGDFIHQQVSRGEGERMTTDWSRSGRNVQTGAILAFLNHFYYQWLDRRVRIGTRGQIVAKKLAIDTSCAPIFASFYILIMNKLEGRTLTDGVNEYKKKCLQLFAIDLFLWVPAQAFNFWFVPPYARVLFVSTTTLLDSFLLTHIKHRDRAEREQMESNNS